MAHSRRWAQTWLMFQRLVYTNLPSSELLKCLALRKCPGDTKHGLCFLVYNFGLTPGNSTSPFCVLEGQFPSTISCSPMVDNSPYHPLLKPSSATKTSWMLWPSLVLLPGSIRMSSQCLFLKVIMPSSPSSLRVCPCLRSHSYTPPKPGHQASFRLSPHKPSPSIHSQPLARCGAPPGSLTRFLPGTPGKMPSKYRTPRLYDASGFPISSAFNQYFAALA